MNAPEFILLLTLIRLIVPFGLLIILGELVRHRNASHWLRS